MYTASHITRTSRPGLAAVLLSMVVLSLGCEKPHPATDTFEAALEALQYGDADGLFDVHVESTDHGVYCGEGAFETILAKAKELRSEEECAQVAGLTSEDIAAFEDEARLVMQVVAMLCERPSATCHDYARRVFDEQLSETELSDGEIESWKIRKVIGDDMSAVAYVDLNLSGDAELHRAVRAKRLEDGWHITDGLLERKVNTAEEATE